MRLLVAVDGHFVRTVDNKYWCKTIYSYRFFERYLDIFDDVLVVARTKSVEAVDASYKRIDGEHVKVREIPFYQGPRQLLLKYLSIHKSLADVDSGCDAALLRLPEQSAFMVYSHLRPGIPVAGEIVYDPTDDLKRKDVNIVIKILNHIISNRLKNFCKKANGVSYVTESSIQKNYPSFSKLYGEDNEHFESFYSTITLSDDTFLGPKKYSEKDVFTLVLCDAAMNSDRKGEDTFLKVIKNLHEKSRKIKGIIIGDGSLREYYENMASDLGIRGIVEFTGLLPSSTDVQKCMRNADIFLFPTKAEGLPRVVIEAMAVGLPVLSTGVGGIPELIDKEYLFNAKDDAGFSNIIDSLMNNPIELDKMSEENYITALKYRNSVLQPRRNDFYRKLFDLAQRGKKV